ncbi:MAG: glycoside hydrolase family 65 protein [Clostridiales bacterium]|nr:glycoside hydrolase family 65 protein [Clostridiales bacterium]
MRYNNGKEENKNWIISEDTFDSYHLGKCESIMCLGNGYLGVRSSTEESYINAMRGTFIAGSFNKCEANEVTELPNIPDVIGMELLLDGTQFSLDKGQVIDYSRDINLKNGQLTRTFIWVYNNLKYKFTIHRFVSLENIHLVCQKIEMTPLSQDMELELKSGINGQVTNNGAAHFVEGDKRIYENRFIQYVTKTNESDIAFFVNTTHNISIDCCLCDSQGLSAMDRRKVLLEHNIIVPKGSKLVIEKISNFHTTNDCDNKIHDLKALKEYTYRRLEKQANVGYDELFKRSSTVWLEKVWNNYKIEIKGCDYTQLAIRFAIYHMIIMTPVHDNRMNIAAKGLTGEGYKGHSFWDTDIFVLPFYVYSNPKIARKLLENRYLSIDAARNKAKQEGYEGAMYPWESASINDGEVTPLWGNADVVTGLPIKIWTGILEQHISADITFAIWQYYMITDDLNYMEKYGYEIIFDTATFWASRVELQDNKYVIKNVIGPDEYKEHVDNNAFTNYMAHFNVSLAIFYYEHLSKNNKRLFDRLNKKIGIRRKYSSWKDCIDKLVLPQPNEDGIIPQADGYLDKKIIKLEKYRNQSQVGNLFKDYNLEQINQMQVLKQADVLLLIFLLESSFSKDVKIANWNYYEPKTLHDSSLSLATHSILANDLGNSELAYSLLNRTIDIDMGQKMKSSDWGIHAASLGGIWQCVVLGFGGVRMVGGILRIEPELPKQWDELKFTIYYKRCKLLIVVDKKKMRITRKGDSLKTICFVHKDLKYELGDKIIIML